MFDQPTGRELDRTIRLGKGGSRWMERGKGRSRFGCQHRIVEERAGIAQDAPIRQLRPAQAQYIIHHLGWMRERAQRRKIAVAQIWRPVAAESQAHLGHYITARLLLEAALAVGEAAILGRHGDEAALDPIKGTQAFEPI